ncbi:hypothetical protein C4D60_Mb08t28790 [Musa balbisiana]|uniref:Uncharacterized protein n=1 Tax=Musa balbisiana TaxID=52838 RepID=A0A4S8K7A4_MUSBA|nr:hypothetical protein C4D60_Mb08t28790 [Musa balbisiana]
MLTLFLSYMMEMPVEVHKHGVWLLANSISIFSNYQVDHHIHRILTEEDAKAQYINELWNASSEAGEKLYKSGDILESQIADIDVYLLRKVGLFPDVIERKVSHHLERRGQENMIVASFIKLSGFQFC